MNRLAYAMAWDLARNRRDRAGALARASCAPRRCWSGFGVTEANWRDAVAKDPTSPSRRRPLLRRPRRRGARRRPEVAAQGGQALFAADLADEYGFTDIDGRRPAFDPMFERVTAELAEQDGDLDRDQRFLVFARYLQIHREPAQADKARPLAAKLGFAVR